MCYSAVSHEQESPFSFICNWNACRWRPEGSHAAEVQLKRHLQSAHLNPDNILQIEKRRLEDYLKRRRSTDSPIDMEGQAIFSGSPHPLLATHSHNSPRSTSDLSIRRERQHPRANFNAFGSPKNQVRVSSPSTPVPSAKRHRTSFASVNAQSSPLSPLSEASPSHSPTLSYMIADAISHTRMSQASPMLSQTSNRSTTELSPSVPLPPHRGSSSPQRPRAFRPALSPRASCSSRPASDSNSAQADEEMFATPLSSQALPRAHKIEQVSPMRTRSRSPTLARPSPSGLEHKIPPLPRRSSLRLSPSGSPSRGVARVGETSAVHEQSAGIHENSVMNIPKPAGKPRETFRSGVLPRRQIMLQWSLEERRVAVQGRQALPASRDEDDREDGIYGHVRSNELLTQRPYPSQDWDSS